MFIFLTLSTYLTSFTTHYNSMVMSGTGELTTLRLLRKLRLRNVGKVEKEEKIETPEEKKINGGLNGAGKYSKRRSRSCNYCWNSSY